MAEQSENAGTQEQKMEHPADSAAGAEQSSGKKKHDAGSPRSALELMRRNVSTIRQLEEEANKHQTRSDRISDAIAAFCGSMTFVYVHVLLFALWIIVNVVPGIGHIDPYPFEFLTLAVSLEAIFLSTFILISQNHDMRLSERRNHLDLQINLLTEQENTTMLSLLRQIAVKVGVDVSRDPNIAIMEEVTDPKDLAGQIEETMEKEKSTPQKSQ